MESALRKVDIAIPVLRHLSLTDGRRRTSPEQVLILSRHANGSWPTSKRCRLSQFTPAAHSPDAPNAVPEATFGHTLIGLSNVLNVGLLFPGGSYWGIATSEKGRGCVKTQCNAGVR